jgi:hypothetical protein
MIKTFCTLYAFPMGASRSQFNEQVTRFAQEVMPAFRPQRVKV